MNPNLKDDSCELVLRDNELDPVPYKDLNLALEPLRDELVNELDNVFDTVGQPLCAGIYL